MHCRKTTLAKMEQAYALELTCWKGKTCLMVASEGHDPRILLVFQDNLEEPAVLIEGRGGCMGVGTTNEIAHAELLVIERFYPTYQSEAAQLTLYREVAGDRSAWESRCLAMLPYLHRFVQIQTLSVPAIVAATLCGSKQAIDDWSSPGAIYLIRNEGGDWKLADRPVLGGLHQNHGMYIRRRDDVETIYVAAKEGIFVLSPAVQRTTFDVSQIVHTPTSDVFIYDIDDDGEDEMLVIQPFHGNSAALLKHDGAGWNTVWSTEISFGHVLWMGHIGSRPALLLGSRSGSKSLTLYLRTSDARWCFEAMRLDEECEPMNARVCHYQSATRIFATNGIGEIALYTIAKDSFQ